MDKNFEKAMKIPGFAWRIGVSIFSSIIWLCFLIIWLFFYASHFTAYQNIAIFLVSILLLGAILGPSWAVWGIKYGHKFECKENSRTKRNTRKKSK